MSPVLTSTELISHAVSKGLDDRLFGLECHAQQVIVEHELLIPGDTLEHTLYLDNVQGHRMDAQCLCQGRRLR